MTFGLFESVQAVVVYHQEEVRIGRIDRVPYPDPVDFDLNSDGEPDIVIGTFRFPNFGHLGVSVLGSSPEVEFLSEIVRFNTGATRRELSALSSHELISDSSSLPIDSLWTSGGGIISEFYSDSFPEVVQGPFADGAAYLGIRFQEDDEFHYGYVHLRGEGATGATVFGYAWETEPGKAIAAGAVPEPSSVLCTVIGLLAWSTKRRRVQ